MRLLPLTLSLLLIASTSLGAPAGSNDPSPSNDDTLTRTSIEVIYEAVTKTVIHELPTESTEVKPCSCKDGVEGSGLAVEDTVVEDTVPAKDTVTETDEEVTDRADSGTNYPVSGSDVIGSGPATGNVPEVTIAEAPVEQTTTCDCEQTKECRKESLSTMDGCMKECDSHLEVYGNNKDQYRACFSKNNASIVEAENCLFEDTNCKDTKTVEDPTDWDSLSNTAYEAKTDAAIENNFYWKRDVTKYTNIQTFFHCTKNCMHKKVQECTSAKKCTIQMPEEDKFAAKMRECTKKNSKIAQSIFAACQCLAWSNGVKDLRGSCVIIGNQFYIDRA